MGKRITALTAQKRNPRRINVFLEGEFAFGLERIVAAWLYVGQELSEEKIADLQAGDQQEAAYQRALQFLQYRSRSEHEIERHLKEHDLPEPVISEVMERLRRSNLVGDGSFARTWVENRTEFRPRSRRALSYELRQKGIDSETIQDTLQDLDDSKLALQAALKQAWKYRSLEWADFRLKMLAFLARRGFSYQTAAEATRLTWEANNDRQAEPVDPIDHDIPDEEVDL